MNRVEIGKIGEMQARRILEEDGYKVINVNGAADLVAERNGSGLSVNVKSGRNFHIASQNLERLMQNQDHTPALMFVGEKVSYIFTLEKVYHHNLPIPNPMHDFDFTALPVALRVEKEGDSFDFTALSTALQLGECQKCGFIIPKPFKSWTIGGTKIMVWSCVCGNRWRTAEANK